jgi:hypothetical protein
MPGKKPEIARQLLKISSMVANLFGHTNGLLAGTGSNAQDSYKKQEDHYQSVHGDGVFGDSFPLFNAICLYILSPNKPIL